VHLAFHDVVLACDHQAGRCWLISSGWPEADPRRRRKRAHQRLEQVADWLGEEALAEGRQPAISADAWRSNFTRPGYLAAIERVRDYIRAGDIYQANIAQCFTATLPEGFDNWHFYRALRQANPAPFAAYLACGARTIASSSPERFLRLNGDAVETRPIKGTAARSPDATRDRELAAALLASEKDRAENVMIVDLVRNDLSRVSRPGSVEVPALCALETYAGVHHLVSAVTGRLGPGKDGLDLLAACFPGGSITGAPKIRAMQIIAEIERAPREVYCGAIGWLGFDGNMDWNIAIRTVTLEGGEARFQVGGGITLLSDAAAEYQETLSKAGKLFDAFAAGAPAFACPA
jgi:para-aminobenzoate synthetase component 1